MTSSGTSRPMAPLEYTLTMTLPAGSSTKPVDCRYTGSGLTKAPVREATAGRVGAVADREGQLVPGDQGGGGLLVIDRKGDDADARVRQRLTGPLEGPQLRVAVGAPGAPVEQ